MTEDNEISFQEGEKITDVVRNRDGWTRYLALLTLKQEKVDPDWFLGSNTHGQRGLFPGNYVEED